MIRAAVIDDEPLARSGVRARIAAHADMVVVGEYADGRAALEGLRATMPDLVFIDVQMPGLSGIDVLAALPESQRPIAILLTAHDRFAVRAFALRAIDYLLKPIDDERFREALDRARDAYEWRRASVDIEAAAPARRHATRFEVRIGRRLQFVSADAIEWVEADGDYAQLHVGDQTYLLRESLGRLMQRLDGRRFVRVHRSAIVRADCVTELQPLANRDAVLRLRDGTPVRVSRTYIDPLICRLRGDDG